MSGKTALEMSTDEWRKYHPFRGRKSTANSPSEAEEARRVAVMLAHELKSRFGAGKVRLFGSLARGEFSGRSDIDLAVWGISPREFYRAVAFASGFNKIWPVDLVDVEDCPEALRRSIEQEGFDL
jgi:predicted nucleotidyltransferase